MGPNLGHDDENDGP